MSPSAATRPLCAETARSAGEAMTATASRVERWVLLEYAGRWPYDPLDAAPLAGRVRQLLAGQLAELPRTRLLLVKRPARHRDPSIRLLLGATPERGARFSELTLDRYSDLLDLDLQAAFAGPLPGAPLRRPALLVCTHGTRDRCCARFGQPVCERLHRLAPPEWLWQASHVGGDRFAGNVVALPEGLYFGRVRPADVGRLLAAYREGRIALDLYRGRAAYASPVQAAEIAVRGATGLDGIWDLRLRDVERLGDAAWRVRLEAEVAGDVHEVHVERELGPAELLTCRAEQARHARHFVAREQRVLGRAG